MRNYFFLSFLSVLFFTACNKPTEPPVPEDGVISAFTRTVSYNNSSTVKMANYDAAYNMEAHADAANNAIAFSFVAAPKTSNSEGDAITLKIGAENLQSGLEKTYTFGATTSALVFGSYSYLFKNADGTSWNSTTDSNMGNHFTGTLTITKYDAASHSINGYYNVQVSELITDPTVKNSTPPSADFRAMVMLIGSFENVKLTIP